LAPAADRAWPIGGPPLVTRRFDPPARRWLPGHRGVDLAGSPGTVVNAAVAGVVFFAGPVAGRGVVSVQHAGGLRTTYQPVDPVVSAGDPVAAGDPLGVLAPGHAGCPAAACLHWGLRQGETYLDPLALLGLGQVRLLPVHQAGSGIA
jgi:murein DD-endopeptidase MepM/ murein hydrolase activator NlpD